eukprot:3217614-Rhodomonas_salina.1
MILRDVRYGPTPYPVWYDAMSATIIASGATEARYRKGRQRLATRCPGLTYAMSGMVLRNVRYFHSIWCSAVCWQRVSTALRVAGA